MHGTAHGGVPLAYLLLPCEDLGGGVDKVSSTNIIICNGDLGVTTIEYKRAVTLRNGDVTLACREGQLELGRSQAVVSGVANDKEFCYISV